jgi:uncharacterized protein with GYD domain
MPKFMLQVSYTPEGAKGVLKQGGTKRRAVAEKAAKSVGGKVESFYFAFGDSDAIVIADLPDAAAAAAIALTLASSGGVRARTTVLISPEDIDKAAKLHTKYSAPGK